MTLYGFLWNFIELYEIFRWARPTSISEFSRFPCVRAYVHPSVRVRKLVEAKLTNQMKIKVDRLDKWTPKNLFHIHWT